MPKYYDKGYDNVKNDFKVMLSTVGFAGALEYLSEIAETYSDVPCGDPRLSAFYKELATELKELSEFVYNDAATSIDSLFGNDNQQ